MVRLNKIVKEVKYCSYFESSVGLMFSRKKERALVFTFDKEKLVPLHMFFVFYAIDVLFLDKNKRSEEHTSELQSHSFISYAVFCLKKKTKT